MDMNLVVMIGRLTADAKISSTRNGNTVASFSIAVNGLLKDEVDYFDIEYYGKGAESIGVYLKKGKQIDLWGRLKQERWQNNDGQNRSRIKLIATHVGLLGPSENNRKPEEPQSQTIPDGLNGPESFDDSDIPF